MTQRQTTRREPGGDRCGAVIAALPAFALVRDWVLSIEGGPLVSLAIATNILAALTGSASGGLTIALDALGETYMRLASAQGIDPALLHRVAVMSAGTLDSLPHNGAVMTLLAVCGVSHGSHGRDADSNIGSPCPTGGRFAPGGAEPHREFD
jgi:H+/gluconate symporter-like permease